MSDHFFVVTSGPGAGKISLFTELTRREFHTLPRLRRRNHPRGDTERRQLAEKASVLLRGFDAAE